MTLTQAKRLGLWYADNLPISPTNSDLVYVKGFAARLNELAEDKIEKGMRWLGFIQGVLWANGDYPLSALKRHSKLASQDRWEELAYS